MECSACQNNCWGDCLNTARATTRKNKSALTQWASPELLPHSGKFSPFQQRITVFAINSTNLLINLPSCWQWPNGHTVLDILDPYVMAVGLTASVQYFKQKTSRQILWLRMLRGRSTRADVLMVRWKLASCKAKKGVWILQCCRVPRVGLFFLQPFSDLWATPLAFVDSRNQ